MATIEDLEERKLKEPKTDEFVDDQDGLIYADLVAALGLLKKATLLLDYCSDTDLCKTVSKRERNAMSRLSDKISSFVSETEESYGDE